MRIEVILKLDDEVQRQLNRLEIRQEHVIRILHALCGANPEVAAKLTQLTADLKASEATLTQAVKTTQ